jgi:hypothetical protein
MEKLLLIFVTLIGVKLIEIDAVCTPKGNCDISEGGESGKLFIGSKYRFTSAYQPDFQTCMSNNPGFSVDYNCETGECNVMLYINTNPCDNQITCWLYYVVPEANHLSYIAGGKK